MLHKLFDNAKKNNSNSTSNRHDETVKHFAACLFCLIGKANYEFLVANLGSSLPSVSTVQRLVSKEKKLCEGEFDFDELVKHLKRFNAPFIVNVHLDDTRIIHRIEYDSKSDTFVGFCMPLDKESKLPIRDTFCLHTYEDIENAFRTEKIAKYAHCIVAQPIDIQSPSFVLSIIGTDSSYDAEVIMKRWKYIESEMNKREVKVLTFGADGAGPFLKAMVHNSKLFQSLNNETLFEKSSFFLMPDYPEKALYSQDTIHILAKMRTKLITPSNILVLGNENGCRAHIQFLIDNKPKAIHGLTNKCINQKDKQNYESINSLVDDCVLQSLKELNDEKRMKTNGTIVYLKMMRDIRDAFLDKSISPLKRINLIWRNVFFLRIWRTWLTENGYPECEHFVTANAYTCIEINAHMLTLIVRRVIEGNLPTEALRFWKTGSQSCEQLFRLLRSMTPTFSTIINFTLHGLLQKTHKLRYLSGAEACGEIEFPRAKRRLLQVKNESAETFHIPTLVDLNKMVIISKEEALDIAKSCRIELASYSDDYLTKGRLQLAKAAEENDGEGGNIEDSTIPINIVPENIDEDVQEDLNNLRLVKSSKSGLPTYSNVVVDTTQRTYAKRGFIRYKGEYIRKSTALYLLQENVQLSNDRLLRVRSDQPSHLLDVENVVVVDSFAKVGDFAIFKRFDNDKFLIGKIVQFSYLDGKKRDRQYSSNFVDVSKDSYKSIGVFADWYVISGEEKDGTIFLEETDIFTTGYLSMEQYYCKFESGLFTLNDCSRLSITSSQMSHAMPQWRKCLTFQDSI